MLPFVLVAVGGAALYYALRRDNDSRHGSRLPRTRSLSNPDRFETLEQVKDELTKRGLESCNLILGVDFTKSNTWTGKETFHGKCLHDLSADGQLNPYQHVISIIARSLAYFDDDQLVPVYGFGDASTNDRDVFSFNPADQPCVGLDSILDRYSSLVPLVRMAGPTSFGPIIRRAIDIVESTGRFHLLIIIADGQVFTTRSDDNHEGNLYTSGSLPEEVFFFLNMHNHLLLSNDETHCSFSFIIL
eukprot:TRINITY_DN1915_c0_g2_i4.p1 TRINITY_DN1915_c0_g2~~TRINITY_DN1915_c0_g2_i4.p1  ORF type:complete len:245 (+),score=40.75 TRINITY_DN1915_c0_g2_i4:57-791(+)